MLYRHIKTDILLLKGGIFMEIRVLKYFLSVANYESISQAAKALHITQPTLSRQIMELEKELGTTLFSRGKRSKKIVLTPDGLLLKKRAQEIVDLADKTKAQFDPKNSYTSGDVYIGGGETKAMSVVARASLDLKKQRPNIRIHIFSGNADDVTERLDKGILDFGLLIGPAKIEKYDYLKLPLKDTWGLLIRKDSPLAQKDFIVPNDLKSQQLLMSRQELFRGKIADWFGDDIDSIKISATYNLIYNASIMVQEGMGCALCLDGLVNTAGNSSLCFRPFKPILQSSIYIVWKKHQVFSKPAEEFLEAIKKQISV